MNKNRRRFETMKTIKTRKLSLNKRTISNLDAKEMNSVKGGFDLSDYCNPPDNQTYTC
jgi:natural product precursor